MSNWIGKIIGAILGTVVAGPIGFLIGFFLGHLYDSGIFGRFGGGMGHREQSIIQQVFFKNTFAIMGYIAKCDGRVSEHEIEAARRIMKQMGLNDEQKRDAIKQFNLGKQPDFNLQKSLNELRQACLFNPQLLRTFLEIQIFIIQSDGQVSSAQQAALQSICNQLGIRGFNFDPFRQQQYSRQQHYQGYQQHARPSPRQDLSAAYTLLEIDSSASNDDVKKAYRRLMSKNHPDKLMSQGLPPEMIKLATQKTQKIKEAYETIKQSRGM